MASLPFTAFETSDFFFFLARISNQKRSFTCYPEVAIMAYAREMSHNSARESALQLSRRSSAIAIRLESGENAPSLASTAGAGNSSSPVSRYQRRALSQPEVTTIFGGVEAIAVQFRLVQREVDMPTQ